MALDDDDVAVEEDPMGQWVAQRGQGLYRERVAADPENKTKDTRAEDKGKGGGL